MQNFALPLRIIDAQIVSTFDLADFDCAFGTLVQQLNELLVNIVDSTSPIVDTHFPLEALNQLANAATFPISAGWPMCSSTSFTIELPTIAPSASCHTACACSGREIPQATAIGNAVYERSVRRNTLRSLANSWRSPVTPVRDTA